MGNIYKDIYLIDKRRNVHSYINKKIQIKHERSRIKHG